MKRAGLIVAFAVAAQLLTPKTVHAQNHISLIDTVMGQIGRTSAEIRFDEDEMATWGGDRFRLTHFSLFHHQPTKLSVHSRNLLEDYSEAQSSLSGMITRAARLADQPVRRGLIGDQLESYMVYPDSMIVPSITRSKNILTGAKFNGLKDKIDLIYRIADDDSFVFMRGMKEADKEKYRIRLFDSFIRENDEYNDLAYELVDKVDLSRMLAGSQDIAEAVDRLVRDRDSLVFPDWVVEFKTRRGMIVIGTAGNDHFKFNPPPLLLIDGGGDDTYEIDGFPDDYPLTVIIDLGGNDTYLSSDTNSAGVGGAALGMAVLVDVSGNDRYETSSLSLGAGLFGVGLLCDKEGDDVYASRHFSQGAGSFGVGLLIDSAGNDSVYCLTTSQGYGYTSGCGILFDYSGDDRYVAEDDSICYPSAQTAEHNVSLAQGAGSGKRADYLDGHSWAGGIGILCDASGDDRYSAGLFAQGVGNWYAVGMLIDGAGRDVYDGVWYVQGAAAHFAVGYLDDMGGDDRYAASHNMALGAGHDFSVGFLYDRGGDDDYSAPDLSLGSAKNNGIGIFYDLSGNDKYRTKSGTTLGQANLSPSGLRKYLNVMGIFVDGGGTDQYVEPHAGNNRRWVLPERVGDNINSPIIGLGLDYDSGAESKTGQD